MLEYQLQHGAIEETIIGQAVHSGRPIPDRIENSPSILPGLELYYIAFQDLNSSRQMGMGLGPIPWVVIQQYCQLKELSDEQTEAMHHHIPLMDTVFLKHHQKKSS